MPLSDRLEGIGDAEPVSSRRVPGVVVLTQTCDIVRSCRERPFVEVAPLLEVDDARLRQTKKALLINRAYIPGLADRRLVADLDRVMTIEKAVLARLVKTPGYSTDAEARAFGEALARKRARPAFPDDFVTAVARLQQRIRDKHGRSSSEGKLLGALREIRIHASPSWNSREVLVRFLFIKDSDPEGLEDQWPGQVERWLDLVDRNGRFVIADPEVGRLEDFTARDYVESDRLDLDWLSATGGELSAGVHGRRSVGASTTQVGCPGCPVEAPRSVGRYFRVGRGARPATSAAGGPLAGRCSTWRRKPRPRNLAGSVWTSTST